MMYSKFSGVGSHTEFVDLRSRPEALIPGYVEFTFSDNSTIKVHVGSFQELRRMLWTDQTIPENKITLIKMVRGLYDLCLKDAKGMAEYFMNNFTIDADVVRF